MRRPKAIGRAARLGVLSALPLILLGPGAAIAAASPANAETIALQAGGESALGDKTCPPSPACGNIINLSWTPIVAYMSWCNGGPCSWSHQRRLLFGQSTPAWEDWDAVWLPCRATGSRNGIPWIFSAGFNRVSDIEVVRINYASC